MSAGDSIALYAALIGTVAFGWQAFTHLRDRQVRLEVSLFLTFFWDGQIRTPTESDHMWDFGAGWRLDVTVRNLGHSAVRIERVSVETPQGELSDARWIPFGFAECFPLQPGESKSAFVTDEQAGQLIDGQTFVGVAETGHKKEFRSDLLDPRAKGNNTAVVSMVSHFEQLAAALDPTAVYRFEVVEFDDPVLKSGRDEGADSD